MSAAADAPVADPHLIGLARVPTDSQDNQLQRDPLTQAGCARIFEETISTRSQQRPGLTANPHGMISCRSNCPRSWRSSRPTGTISHS